MSSQLPRFRTTLDKGIDTFRPDFDSELSWDEDAYNVTSGIVQGATPRFGMAPLVNQNHTEALQASGTGIPSLPGLKRAESANANGMGSRKKIYGIVPLSMVGYWSFASDRRPVYFAIVALDGLAGSTLATTGYIADIQPCSERNTAGNGPFRYKQESLAHGFPCHSYDDLAQAQVATPVEFIDMPGMWRLQKNGGATFTDYARLHDLLTLACSKTAASDVPFLSFAAFTASEKIVKNAWIIGIGSNASANKAPRAAFSYRDAVQPINFRNYPELVVTQRFDKAQHSFRIYGLQSKSLLVDYGYLNVGHTNTQITGALIDYSGAANAGDIVGRLDAAVVLASDANEALINDEKLTTKSGYKAILVAGTKPFAVLFQEWQRNDNQLSANAGGQLHQWVDLTQRVPDVQTYRAINDDGAAATFYLEDGTPKMVCWYTWPTFVRGTPLAKSSAATFDGLQHVRLGEPGSGVLRSFTVYEFAYSLYDKTTDLETNVGTPAKIQTGGDDLVALSIFRDRKAAGIFKQGNGNGPGPYNATFASNALAVNNYELRVYYREEGTPQWVAAGFFDLAQYIWDPNKKALFVCTGPIAALPGGQPGGFVDYSPLQEDGGWNCVVSYKNRVFWIGNQGLTFSLTNNVFCYPKRNYQTIPTGELRGAILHNYPGQAEQSSRLLVFGSDTIYVGRFTGDKLYEPVRVSVDNVDTYPVDGSDFVLDPWTSSAAFSYRAACVADGIVHWWGPGGIYRDNGTETPPKISLSLEPNIFELYDPNYTREIHSVFNDRTKEIYWFYRAPGATTSRAVVYNTFTQEFTFVTFSCAIDAAWQLEVADTAAATTVTGKRTMVSVRDDFTATTQEAFFFDHLERSGDMRPAACILVKTIADQGTNKRLTLALGAPAAGIAVGDYIAFQRANKYNTAAGTISDMIAKVAAVNLPTSIDVTIPTGASCANFTAGTNYERFVPVWHRAAAGAGLNAIAYQIKTNYWMPAPEQEDFNGIWQWTYMRMRLELWPSVDPQTFSLGFRTPTSDVPIMESIALVDNSDGHMQLFHPMTLEGTNNQGQALEYTITGYHIGSKLTFEILGVYGEPEDGNVLKQFEG